MGTQIKKRTVRELREDWLIALNLYGKGSDQERGAYRQYVNGKQNGARRDRRRAYADLGMVRVVGALGGVYYE
jgi:hypothetical protein